MQWGLRSRWLPRPALVLSALERPRRPGGDAIAVAINAACYWALIFGIGMPAMGLTGAGVRARFPTPSQFAGLAANRPDRDRRFRRFHLFGPLVRPDSPRAAEAIRLAAPVSEAFCWNPGAQHEHLLMDCFGASAMAAHPSPSRSPRDLDVPSGPGPAATVSGRTGGGAGTGGVTRAGGRPRSRSLHGGKAVV
jgi:MATE family multidrug resistance protein